MDKKAGFKNEYDAAILAFSILKRLKSGDVSSFNERLKSQKIQYLAQFFGVSPVYSFGLYLRGPYSSDLAHDLFKIKDEKIKASKDKFIPDELEERFAALENFISRMNLRELELVATLHLLLKTGKKGEADAIKRFRELKKATDGEVKFALKAIKIIPQ